MTADPHALAAAYALDALPAEEGELFSRHLDDCPGCQVEVAEFAATAAKLGTVLEQAAPPRLRAAVLDQVAVTRQSPPLTGAAHAHRRMQSPVAWLAAAALVVLAVAGGLVVSEHQRASQLEDREQQLAAVLSAPDAKTDRDRIGQQGRLTVVASRRLDQAVVLVADLPPLDPDRTYQMWLVTDTTPRSVATMDDAGQARTLVVSDLGEAQAVALTVEPAGGSKQPTTPVIADAELT